MVWAACPKQTAPTFHLDSSNKQGAPTVCQVAHQALWTQHWPQTRSLLSGANIPSGKTTYPLIFLGSPHLGQNPLLSYATELLHQSAASSSQDYLNLNVISQKTSFPALLISSACTSFLYNLWAHFFFCKMVYSKDWVRIYIQAFGTVLRVVTVIITLEMS